MGGGLPQVYIDACRKHGVKKPNPYIKQLLSDAQDVSGPLNLDLSANYLGNRGLLALLEVVEQAGQVSGLNLANQKIYNTDLSADSVKGNVMLERLLEVSEKHPSMTSLDVSNNPLSNLAGRKLLGVAMRNTNMCRIGVEDTRIDGDLRGEIVRKCEANAQSLWDKKASAEVAQQQPRSPEDPFAGAQSWNPAAAAAAAPPPNLEVLGAGQRRRTVRAKSYNADEVAAFIPPRHPKSDEEESQLFALLQKHALFGHLERPALQTIVAAMHRETFYLDATPCSEGTEGTTLYVITNGRCDVLKKGAVVAEKSADKDNIFGELELMYDHPCVATVRVACEELTTWAMDRETYKCLVLASAIRQRNQYGEYLAKVPFLNGLSAYEKMQLSDALSTDEFHDGDYILSFGQEGEYMYLMTEGVVQVVGRDAQQSPQPVCELGVGESFGELEFLNNHPCVADVVAKGFVRTAKINRRHFEMCLGPVLDVLQRNAQAPKYEYYRGVLADERRMDTVRSTPQVDRPLSRGDAR